MTPGEPFDPVEITERFFTVIKSLNEFDKAEVRGVIQTLIAPRERDICFTGNYAGIFLHSWRQCTDLGKSTLSPVDDA